MVKEIILCTCLVLTFLPACKLDLTKSATQKKDIYGKVVDHYLDEGNHMELTMIYENTYGRYKYPLSDWALGTDLWEYIDINDSISKPSGSLTLRVIKPDGSYRDYEYRR